MILISSIIIFSCRVAPALLLLLCLFVPTGTSFQSRTTTSGFRTGSRAFSSLLPDPSAFHQSQWNLLQKYQVGKWIGIQTGYDPVNEEVADYMYTQTSLIYDATSDSIIHTQSLVAQEIRSDCETCFDSDRVKTKQVGQYSLGKLRTRLCENGEVRGPGLTSRGVSCELILRHDDGRVRVLFAYTPFASPEDKGGVIFRLTDFVVVRERTSKRPLRADLNPDPLWHKVQAPADASSLYSGTRHSYANGLPVSEVMSGIPLPRLLNEYEDEFESRDVNDDGDGKDDDIYLRRVLEGRIIVESVREFPVESEARIRLSWQPPPSQSSSDSKSVVYAAEAAFYIPPSTGASGPIPVLASFSVDHLTEVDPLL